jgi:hypothetical protein
MTPESAKPQTGVRGFDLQVLPGRRKLQSVLSAVGKATTARNGMRGNPMVLSYPTTAQ